MQPDELDTVLPWRYPFRMIDRMVECEPGRKIVTDKRVTAADPMTGPDRAQPALPSMLLLEGLSQSAALLYRLTYTDAPGSVLPLLGFLKASIETRGVYPGEAVTYTVRAIKMTREGGVFEAEAAVDGEAVARAELAFKATESV